MRYKPYSRLATIDILLLPNSVQVHYISLVGLMLFVNSLLM